MTDTARTIALNAGSRPSPLPASSATRMATPALGDPLNTTASKDMEMERVTFQNKGNPVAGNLFKPDGAGW